MGTKEHAKINYFAETMDEAAAMLHKQQERIEELQAELAKIGLTMTKPIPCGKFRGAPTPAWVAKLNEEVHEVIEEAKYLENFKANHYAEIDIEEVGVTEKRLAMELTDVITVCTSWLDTLGYDEAARERLQERVNEKNRKRGYHDE